jgi:putative flavoprotein involved in K+ transport
MATGASDMPREVDIPSLANYRGRVIHAGQYQSAEGFAGRHVTVIGTGTSGHDIAQDLVSNGASVTLVQRSPTLVVNVEPAAQIPYALYSEGRPLEECDLIAASAPMALVEKSHRLMAVQSREMDRELLAGLRRAGFRINDTDERGWQFMFLTRGGGYYFNVGCSELIIAGKLPVAQFSDIETFTADGLQMKDGRTQSTDMIVLATGYHNQEVLVKKLFGDTIAARVGKVWGIDWEKQELNSMFTHTGQSGLWFIAGSFAQCRIYSKYLALQIKAVEVGLTAN